MLVEYLLLRSLEGTPILCAQILCAGTRVSALRQWSTLTLHRLGQSKVRTRTAPATHHGLQRKDDQRDQSECHHRSIGFQGLSANHDDGSQPGPTEYVPTGGCGGSVGGRKRGVLKSRLLRAVKAG